MAIFKCKMCGGSLEIDAGTTVVECEYCGTQQTLPKTNDEVLTNLFNRANNLRLKCEFDKAAEIYEKIVQQDDSEAEAHWGLVLCKYGIEYVEDPKTLTRIPTCHRTRFDAVIADVDYLAAVDYSDMAQQQIYEREARAIDKIQKDILAIVKNEKPFDVFICYKETDANGKRTIDSTIANDIYYQLTQEGLKVFFAAITLEDKLGQEYEPYIFAALNSAKVMLALGTKPEYFSAVWVKNEWSRFLNLMKSDRSKLLIPCYRDMDAYDLPEEFAHLQAQDMSKIGFINDVVRGIKKVVQKEESQPAAASEVVVSSGADTAPLLKRVFMFLEDGEWAQADEYCEKVLDMDPENAEAYLGKLMVELKVNNREDLVDKVNAKERLSHSGNYTKAMRYGDDKFRGELEGYTNAGLEREYTRFKRILDTCSKLEGNLLEDRKILEKAAETLDLMSDYKDSLNLASECREIADICYKEDVYRKANAAMEKSVREFEYKEAAKLFEKVLGYKNSVALRNECREKAETARKDEDLAKAKQHVENGGEKNLSSAIVLLQSIAGWKDADDLLPIAEGKLEEIKRQELVDREAKRKDNILAKAKSQMNSSDVKIRLEVIELLQSISGWKDADEKAQDCQKWLDSKIADACKLLKVSTLENKELVQFHKLNQDLQHAEKVLIEAKEVRKKGLKNSVGSLVFCAFFCALGYFCMMKNQAEGWELFPQGLIVFCFVFAAICVFGSCIGFIKAPKTSRARASYQAAKDAMNTFRKKCREKK